jgi:hypothetical protein
MCGILAIIGKGKEEQVSKDLSKRLIEVQMKTVCLLLKRTFFVMNGFLL